MTDPSKEEAISRRMDRANESVSEAELLIAHGHWNAAVSRLYYAVFFAANAYLIAHDRANKTHKGTRMAFGALINENQEIPRDVAKVYHDLFEERHHADYGFFSDLDGELVLPMLDPVRTFIHAVANAVAAIRS